MEILQRTIAVGTAQGGRGNVRVLRYRGGSHRAWTATLGRCGDVVAHTRDRSNRLAASSARNHAQLAAVLSLFWSVEVSVRSNSHDKGLAVCNLPVTQAEQQKDCWVYCSVSIDNSISRPLGRAFDHGSVIVVHLIRVIVRVFRDGQPVGVGRSTARGLRAVRQQSCRPPGGGIAAERGLVARVSSVRAHRADCQRRAANAGCLTISSDGATCLVPSRGEALRQSPEQSIAPS